jgi:predicted metal-dependent peptidase
MDECNPSKIHVLYVDAEVQQHDEFDSADEVEFKFRSGGGTRMEAGFAWVQANNIEPDVVITLTDGYDHFTKAPDFPVVWVVSSEQKPPYGMVIPFKVKE